MRNFQGKKGRGANILESVPVLIILVALLLFFAWGVLRFIVKMRDTGKNKEIAQMKVAELAEAKEKLGGDIENLKTERGVEENIREKFGLAKEGEGLIVVVDDKNAQNPEEEGDKNWFVRFLKNWFRR